MVETHFPYKLPERSHESLENQQENDISRSDDGKKDQSNEHNDEKYQLGNEERPQREIRIPRYLKDYYMTVSANIDYACSVIQEIPQSY